MTTSVFYRHFHTLHEAGQFLSGRWQGRLQSYDRQSHAVPEVEYELYGQSFDQTIVLQAALNRAEPVVAVNYLPSRWVLTTESPVDVVTNGNQGINGRQVANGNQRTNGNHPSNGVNGNHVGSPVNGTNMDDRGAPNLSWVVELAHGADLPRRATRPGRGDRQSNPDGLSLNEGQGTRRQGSLELSADNLGGVGDSSMDWNIYALTADQIYLCAFDASGGKRTVMLLGNLNRRRRRFWPVALHFIDSRRLH